MTQGIKRSSIRNRGRHYKEEGMTGAIQESAQNKKKKKKIMWVGTQNERKKKNKKKAKKKKQKKNKHKKPNSEGVSPLCIQNKKKIFRGHPFYKREEIFQLCPENLTVLIPSRGLPRPTS